GDTTVTPSAANSSILTPTLALLPIRLDTPEARVMLLAIAMQESELIYRRQSGGPARGLWQFESEGVQGVIQHPATKAIIAAFLSAISVIGTVTNIFNMLTTDDVLACAIARLLLWTDPLPLPAVNDVDGGWQCYLRNWRPGAPRPEDWPTNHAAALAAIVQ
ncbi:MAG: hypothetical protein ACREPT_11460, partial [Rudaea sp.]